jgi:hypothetical protein
MATTELAINAATASDASRVSRGLASPDDLEGGAPAGGSQRPRRTTRAIIAAYAALWLLTAAAALAGALVPSLGPSRAPHPTLEPSATAIATILLTNVRALAPPFLLAAFRFGSARASRAFGDLLVATPLALIAIRVGAALGRWNGRLIPYIPQLPIEHLAAAIAAAVWIAHRKAPARHGRSLTRSATLVLIALAAAAAIEVLATPHPR